MTTPTPEQFLAMPTDPDEEEVLAQQPPPDSASSLNRIADSLRHLVNIVAVGDREMPSAQGCEHAEDYADLQREYDELEGAYRTLEARLDEVLEICKPSTSKLADRIRGVLALAPVEDTATEEPEPPQPPAHDAPVEEWRAYARTQHGVTEGTFIDQMNRSQIRTMLGIPHGASEGADR